MANIPKLLSYPASLGKDVAQGQHYMLIDSYESSSAVDREGQGTRISSIALYIPPGALTTTIGQNYEALKGGARLAAMGASEGAGASDVLIDAMTSVVTKPRIIDDFRAAGHGLARNAHMALVYRGPSAFRSHAFQFEFWPKSEDETKIVQTILNDFQQGSTPRMGASIGDVNKLTAPYFHAPRQWEIKFCKGKTIEADRQAQAATGAGGTNPYLFQIQRSVIESITVNHDPDGVVGFHADGAPVHTRLGITFKEIQYVTSTDKISEEAQDSIDSIESRKKMHAAVTAHASTPLGRSPSDYRLKDNITLLQEEGFGIPNIYSFNYKWDAKTTWIGVMAQELLDTGYSNAVGIDSEGFYNVDYSRLGFPMIGVRQ